MNGDRIGMVARALAEDDGPEVLNRLCGACVELLDVDGAGIAIVDEHEHRGAIAVSDERFAAVDDLQFQLGEGPSIDADRWSRPVLEPDLARAAPQWPAFVEAALAAGVRAHFAYPLQVGAAHLGVLAFHRRSVGDLTASDATDAMALTRIARNLMLERQAHAVPGELPDRLLDVAEHRVRVHQATGMIAAQTDEDVGTALSRLRTHAWAHDLSIESVAEAVIGRRLRFDDT